MGPPAPLPQRSEAKILGQLLALAREIRRPRMMVGHSAFICCALLHKCKPMVWEGSTRVNLVEAYAPWATFCQDTCVVDAVCCCFEPAVAGGLAEMVEVSETHTLRQCRHYVAATPLSLGLHDEGTSMQSFYNRLSMVLLGTVMDGDCGIDAMCQMIGRPQTAANRLALREESRTRTGTGTRTRS